MSRSGRMLLASLTAIALLMSPLLISPALADLTAVLVGPDPDPGLVGEKVKFDGSGSIPGDEDIKSYVFDFGDGTDPKRDKDGRVGHTYDQPGTYLVTLTVIDDERETSTASTFATIIDPTPTSSTTTTSTTLPSTTIPDEPTTTTTTTTIPYDPTTIPYDPTTTSITTSTTTTLPPTTTSTRVTTTAPPTTSTTTTTEPTGQVLGQTLEATGPAAGISATAFSLVPATAAPGSEIALSLNLIARVPGQAAVQFLLDGEPLGEPATLFASGATVDTDTQAVFTRTMPTGIRIGLHRVDVVTVAETPQILASRTVGVVAGASAVPVALDQDPPPPSSRFGLSVAIALAAAVALTGAVFAGTTWYRRKAIVRRLNP